MSSRETILASVRRSLGRTEALPERSRRELETRLESPPEHPRPAFEESPVTRFRGKLEASGGTFSRFGGVHELSGAIADYVRTHQLPARIVASGDTLLGSLEWPSTLEVSFREAHAEDAVSVTTALLAVAETGSVVLASGEASPTTLAFLPEHHLVVVPRSRLALHLEDVWTKLREAGPGLPRAVNLISAPSKTGDVEQTLQIGAHGPRRLHVLLYDD